MDGRPAAPGHGDHATEMVTMKRIAKAAAAALLIVAMLPAIVHAADKALWKIGNFDGSSGEFKSQDINYADPKNQQKFRDWLRTKKVCSHSKARSGKITLQQPSRWELFRSGIR